MFVCSQILLQSQVQKILEKKIIGYLMFSTNFLNALLSLFLKLCFAKLFPLTTG